MGRFTYLGMLLPWAFAVLAVQWLAGPSAIRRRLRLVVVATAVPTVYLTLADSLALSQGIWSVHDDRILGVRLGNVPLEEGLFFLLTNLIVVQSVILLNDLEVRRRLWALMRRLRGSGGA